ncbi:MAG: hypothetical protein HYX51_10100 [Chloroflexi bacterium]|nr:hypothetical protein [Chloroflexota bacterium]
MCLDWRCGKPNDDHGEPEKHITMDRLERAAQANNTSPREVAQRIAAEAGKQG